MPELNTVVGKRAKHFDNGFFWIKQFNETKGRLVKEAGLERAIGTQGASMGFPIVRLGDLTSHGGTVITASMTHTIDGIGIARVGDNVACPMPGHGVNAIVEGEPNYLIGGRMVALHGHRAACGCTLIASLVTATHG